MCFFSRLHEFMFNYAEFFQNCGKNNLDTKLVSTIIRENKKVRLDIHAFVRALRNFLNAYDNFVVCGNNIFNFEITSKPKERF